MLVLFVNTLTASDKYSSHKRENLAEQIEMQISQKRKTLSRSFFSFLQYTSNSEYFQKKHGSHSLSVSEIIESKRGGYLNA